MPCYTRQNWQTQKIKIENHQWFRDGLSAQHNLTVQEVNGIIYIRGVLREGEHKWSIDAQFDTKTGNLKTRTTEEADALKRNYARTVVSKAAKRFGWFEEKTNSGIKLKRRS